MNERAQAMPKKRVFLLAIGALFFLMGCSDTQTKAEFACPVLPPPKPLLPFEPPFKSDQSVLADPEFYEEMIKYGSNNDLRGLLIRAHEKENYPFVPKQSVKRVKRALEIRESNMCPDVPHYNPARHYALEMNAGNVITGEQYK